MTRPGITGSPRRQPSVPRSWDCPVGFAGRPDRAEIGGVVGDALEPVGGWTLLTFRLIEIENGQGAGDDPANLELSNRQIIQPSHR